MNAVKVKRAGLLDADKVGVLVYRLLLELNPEKYAARDATEFSTTARRLLQGDDYCALLAMNSAGTPIAVLTLNECSAIYAGGHFGEICELYVDPSYRCDKVGAKMIDAAKELGEQRKWGHLEVGAPDVPRWQRTVDFYTAYGFSIVGPRLHIDL